MLEAGEFAFERAGVECVAQADVEPLGADRLHHEIDRARAHRGNDVVDAAVRSLHDDRHGDRRLAQSRQDAETVKVRHDEVEDHAVDARAVRAAEQRQRSIAVIERNRLILEFVQHALEKPALHRIVIDDEDGHC